VSIQLADDLADLTRRAEASAKALEVMMWHFHQKFLEAIEDRRDMLSPAHRASALRAVDEIDKARMAFERAGKRAEELKRVVKL
jgi:hypothetical protein